MKIKEIIVKDFGGIETQIIEPQKITCLLGKNVPRYILKA